MLAARGKDNPKTGRGFVIKRALGHMRRKIDSFSRVKSSNTKMGEILREITYIQSAHGGTILKAATNRLPPF